ncbi:MAG: 30S ribosome-binding factor RbfA [Thermodesulfobacteriota bacterium]
MGTRRTKRLGTLIQAELGELLLKKVRDPRVGMVSLTGVDVSPDLSQAKVYYSLLDQERRAEAQAGLEAAAGFLRRELAARLNLKSMPRLIPVYDHSLARGERMDQLLKQARSQDEELARKREAAGGEGGET